LALPAIMLGIGLMIGQMLYGVFGPRIGLRKLLGRGAIAMMLCAAFAAAVVSLGIFWLYCAAKLMLSVTFGLLYVLAYSLPRLAHDDEQRSMAARAVRRTDTSAAAMGTVLGGYAAYALGNAWVYGLVSLACLPVIIMAFNLLPRGMRPLEALAQPDRAAGRIRDFVRTPTAAGIALLVVLPATLAAGYASFLFPLFSTEIGLSTADINNIVVLGQLAVYMSIRFIESIEGRVGRWRSVMFAVMLMGATFLLLAINTTLVWCITVVAIVALLGKASDGWKFLWIRSAAQSDMPLGRALGAMFAIRSFALMVQPFIMGALLGIGYGPAVIVVGVICLACAALFSRVAHREPLARTEAMQLAANST